MPFSMGILGAHDDASHQGSAKRNTAGGVSGIDTALMQTGSYPYPVVESYNNHLGATDNFTQTAVSTGTATADAANHLMALDSGNGANTYATFATKKQWVVTGKRIVANFLVTGLANGTGSNKITQIGLLNTLTGQPDRAAKFYQDAADAWSCATTDNGPVQQTFITALANGDLLTIVMTPSLVEFFVNGVRVASHTTGITAQLLYAGASVKCISAAGTSRTLSVDLIDVKVHL